jgi:TRAP-type C4-dicarboxylate transport system permease small subunit
MKYIEIAVHKVSYYMFIVAKISLILMAFLTGVDVFGRYFFDSPIIGAQDISELSMVLLIFGAIGWATYKRAHIRADMLYSVISKKKYAVLTAAGFAISLVLSILMTWQTCVSSINSLINSHLVTPTIRIPIAPFKLFTAFGLLVLSLELLFDLIKYIKEINIDESNSDKR